MAQPLAIEPITVSGGLVPRYLREMQANASASPPAVPTEIPDMPHDTRPVDAATADLRRRLAAAGWRPCPASLAMAAPGIAGVSLALGALFST
jgi:hypothetical protein